MPSRKPDRNTLLLIGGGIAFYFIGKKLGLWGGPDRSEDGSCLGPYTLTPQEARIICDGIEAAATGFTEDEAKIANLMMKAQTHGDVCRLFNYFGKRQIGAMGVPHSLVEIITIYLNEPVFIGGTETWIDVINADYAAKGIEASF
jgi:hypothetical protein